MMTSGKFDIYGQPTPTCSFWEVVCVCLVEALFLPVFWLDG